MTEEMRARSIVSVMGGTYGRMSSTTIKLMPQIVPGRRMRSFFSWDSIGLDCSRKWETYLDLICDWVGGFKRSMLKDING